MSDKPMTFDLAQAKELAGLVERTGLQFGLTHNYTGYPMVKEARHMVRGGAIGAVRKVVVEYPQGLAGVADRVGGTEAGELAHRSGATPAPVPASATSAPTPRT